MCNFTWNWSPIKLCWSIPFLHPLCRALTWI